MDGVDVRKCMRFCLNDAQVQLAATSCEDAKMALALEPNNDYAHHLMGRWHYGGYIFVH